MVVMIILGVFIMSMVVMIILGVFIMSMVVMTMVIRVRLLRDRFNIVTRGILEKMFVSLEFKGHVFSEERKLTA